MQRYNPKDIEPKWQKHWDTEQTFAAKEDPNKEKFYALIEFPYPSGAGLHVGHPRPFTAMDVISRKRRMEGYNVLYPIGFDAFGLPTENYAIKTGRPPAEVTAENIANFTRQLKSLGYGFDWSRTIDTTDPKYYKWTQWIFLQLFKHGLAYKKNQPINWCPKDKIGLANEEVVNGACERCGTPVEKRNKEQWMLAITKYADKLLEGLKEVDYITPARVQQENWIGKSEGAEITFKLDVSGQDSDKHVVTVFTTRPDTLFGATFLAVSADLAKSWIDVGWQASGEVKQYVEAVLKERVAAEDVDSAEKTGVDTGVTAINPATGEAIPVWITNYVLGGVGTGAIMAVPAHDERDFDFAKKYNLPVKIVVEPVTGEKRENEKFRKSIVALVKNPKNNTYLSINWGPKMGGNLFVGGGLKDGEDPVECAKREIKEETGYKNIRLIETSEKIHHHYFAHSKNEAREIEAVGLFFELENDEQTELQLEADEKNKFTVEWLTEEQSAKLVADPLHSYVFTKFAKRQCYTGYGLAVNSGFLNGLETKEAQEKMVAWLEEKNIGKHQVNFKLRDWVFSRQRYWGEPIPLVYCEACANSKKFESKGEELNPGWIPLGEKSLPLELPKVEKYEPTDTGESPLAAIEEWVETTCPRCGGEARRETDTMPNWAGSSWYFLRYTDPDNTEAFASQEKLKYWTPVDWYNGGMEHTVLHLLYSRFWNQFLFDIGAVPTSEPYKKRTSHGMILGPDGEKMSKSRGNVINPDEMVDQFGADAFRAYIMFMGPFDQFVQWDTNGLVGVRRFMERAWNLQEKVGDQADETSIITALHQTIRKVSEDIDAMRFNTAIAKMMEFVNDLTKAETVSKKAYATLIQLLAPFAPHMTEELWATYGDGTPLPYSAWPKFDAELAKESKLTIAIQLNGKVRDTIEIDAEMPEETVKARALASEKIQKWLEGKEPKKVIYVKDKLVSIVV